MAKRISKNQLPLDYTVRGDRVVLALGQVESQQAATSLFEELMHGSWVIEPAGEVADVSSAQDIVRHLNVKLPFPEVIKIAQLHQAGEIFVGLSAIYRQKGWVFVNAHADANERFYHAYLLTATLGLYSSYANPDTLAQRAEQLIFKTLLPEGEVKSFFHEGITKIPGFLAADIADFFKVPFPMVLKRALQLEIISDEQYRNYMTVLPQRTGKPRELFVAQEGGIEDLESHLFGENEE